MALFASHGSSGRSSTKNLVEFRAGKMSMKGAMVSPDKRKGSVYVYQADDGLMHFCWKDRSNGRVEDDLIIFPDDCEFKRVAQCTTGRVYILKFKSSTRKYFFWMQEPKTDKDEDHCKKVNDSLNNPPTPGQGSEGGLEHLGQGNLQDMLQNMDNSQFLQLMAAGGGMGGLSSLLSGAGGRQRSSQSSTRSTNRSATTTTASDRASSSPAPAVSATPATPTPAVATPTPATPTSTTAGLQLSQLQNILSDMGMPKDGASGAGIPEAVDLTKVMSPNVMLPILTNPEVQERLRPHLPEGEQLPSTSEQLQDTVSSPQFRQALHSFSEALATGQLASVLKQFGLPASAQEAAAKGDVEGFAKAMQESEGESSKGSSDKKGKDDDDDDKMVVE